MTDPLQALMDAYDKRLETLPPRRPENSPFKPAYQRPERRTRPTYKDPTGSAAVGNIDRERKKRKP